jgi:hypothetical protein
MAKLLVGRVQQPAIFLSEVQLTFTPGVDIITMERKYELCSDTVHRVAFMPGSAPNVSAPIQFPFVPLLPNLYLYCERNCTVEIAYVSPALFVPTAAAAGGAGLVPSGFQPSADNLTLD